MSADPLPVGPLGREETQSTKPINIQSSSARLNNTCFHAWKLTSWLAGSLCFGTPMQGAGANFGQLGCPAGTAGRTPELAGCARAFSRPSGPHGPTSNFGWWSGWSDVGALAHWGTCMHKPSTTI